MNVRVSNCNNKNKEKNLGSFKRKSNLKKVRKLSIARITLFWNLVRTDWILSSRTLEIARKTLLIAATISFYALSATLVSFPKLLAG